MSDFDWERKGPPRPASGSMDHPRGVQRPYVHVTDAEKARRTKAKREEDRARGEAIRKAELRAYFIEHGIDPDDLEHL